MDYIHIDNLIFNGKHGHYEHERRLEQEFALSVRLGTDVAKAAKSDALTDTIDYGAVKKKIQDVLEGESCYLLEKLADDIANRLLEDPRVLETQVTIKKTAIWDNGVPGVTVTRIKE